MNENNMMFKQSVFFDENHELNDTGILLYVDALRLKRENELPDILVEHVANSENDLKRIYEYYEFVKDDDISELTPHPFFDKSSQSNTPIKALGNGQILKIAAAILLLLGVAYIVSIMSGDNPDTPSGISNKAMDADKFPLPPITTETVEDSGIAVNNNNQEQKKVVPQKKLPAFEEVFSQTELQAMHMPYIDRLIERSGNNRSESLQVLYPLVDTEILDQKLSFRWKNPIQDSLYLEVFTKDTEATDRKIYKIAPKDSIFVLSSLLKPFLYYWELKKKQDSGRKTLVSRGRFLIQKRKRRKK
ncbi:hypothetical protein BKI52_43135 [marine bacterium AO1-C]|nr:hypothetical protein BKI52_43135 [marine bacterium AO1-C]